MWRTVYHTVCYLLPEKVFTDVGIATRANVFGNVADGKKKMFIFAETVARGADGDKWCNGQIP